MSGFIASKVYKDAKEAKENMVHYTEKYLPNLENHEKYNYLFNKVYLKIYPQLKKLNKKLRFFTNEAL